MSGRTCIEALEEAVRKSGDRLRGRGSRLALLVLSRDARHSRPSSELQLLAAALKPCHVSAGQPRGFAHQLATQCWKHRCCQPQELTPAPCGMVDAMRGCCIQRKFPTADGGCCLLYSHCILLKSGSIKRAHLVRTWNRSAGHPARHEFCYGGQGTAQTIGGTEDIARRSQDLSA